MIEFLLFSFTNKRDTRTHKKLKSTKNIIKTERYCFFCKGINLHGFLGFGTVFQTTKKFNPCEITPLPEPAQFIVSKFQMKG